MARTNGHAADFYKNSLQESKGKPPPEFEDPSRGCLLAMIQKMPSIWNTTAKLNREDVLACFDSCSTSLQMMKKEYTIWAIIEKWCWMVESYTRCLSTTPPGEWRYNNTLDFLRPYISSSYPYVGCLSKQRLKQLTKLYGDPEITKVMETTEHVEFPPGIFRDELATFAGEDVPKIQKTEAELMTRTVGQMVNAKRRGRPCRGEKRSPADQFTNLTPQSAQFQKLLESTSSASSTNSDSDIADDYGFTPSMYSCLIEMVHEKPELWQGKQGTDTKTQEKLFTEIGKELAAKFKGNVDTTILEKLSGALVKVIWGSLADRFRDEESMDAPSRWKYYQALQFLSARSMPALLLENVFVKSEDPSTSSPLTAKLSVSSPAGSSQSEDSRMAASSPATTSQFSALPMTNGNKSIQTVLENLVARSLKEDPNAAIQNNDYSELKHILEQSKIIKVERDGSPPSKRVKQSASPPGSSSSSSRMIVYNDARKGTQAPISTWVPPREDVTAKPKEESTTPAPKKAQATAVIKSGFPLEKHFKKNPPTLVPVTAASLQSRNGLIGLNPMVIAPSALQQALSLSKIDHSTPTASRSQMPSASTQQPTIQAQVMTNGAQNGTNEQEDKWALLGRMVTMLAREVEGRDPLTASELFRDLQQILCAHQIKSLKPKENNSQQ